MEYKNQVMQPSAAGLGNVGSYQVSGYPWISGSGYLVIASLTGIPASRMWYLTGSGIDSITDI